MVLRQQYGPLSTSLKSIKKLLWISEEAYVRMEQAIGKDPNDWTKPENRILQALMSNALNMSLSVRILVTYGQLLEALVLLRTRLEQLIVCSYLIHSQNGFVQYADDLNRIKQRAVKNFQKDSTLKNVIDGFRAIIFQDVNQDSVEDFMADLSSNPGKVPKRWTDLDIYSMAIKRDDSIENNHPFKSNKLGWSYISIYHLASNVAHCYPPAITENYLSVNPTGGIGPRWEYIILDLLNNAFFDTIQCYEVVKYIKSIDDQSIIALKSEITSLMKKPL